MSARPRFTSHEQYFEAATPQARAILRRIQEIVEAAVPGVTRVIGYGMPAFRGKKIFFYFAAFKEHIGVYPPLRTDAALIEETAPFRGEKGNLSFPLDEPIPYDLIGRVAAALAAEYSGNAPPDRGGRATAGPKRP